MAKITEDYVSFETAKLLKEKGFSENTEHEIWYVIKQFSTGCHWNSCTYKVGDTTREYDDDCCIPMPTLQTAMKWLRGVHNIDISVFPHSHKEGKTFNYEFVYWNGGEYHTPYSEKRPTYHELFGKTWEKYEDAGEAAIKYCLEHLI